MALCIACNLAWGTVPDQIVAVTAVVSAFLVVSQLAGLRSDRQRADNTMRLQLDQFRSEAASARANLLLRIDEQFEDAAVFESRAAWIAMRAEFLHAYAGRGVGVPEQEDFIAGQIVARLNALWLRLQDGPDTVDSGDLKAYHLLTRLPNWIETIGMLARHEMLPIRDLEQLYGGTIRTAMEVVVQHMELRRTRYPETNAFANAVWLYERISAPPISG